MNKINRTLSNLFRILTSLTVLFFAGNALAHAGLEKSVPAANAQIQAAPPELILEFENPVMLMKLTLTDANGAVINLNFKASSALNKAHQFPLPKLNDAHYTVNWSAMGKDGHNMSNHFDFIVCPMAVSTSSVKQTDIKQDEMKQENMKDATSMSPMNHDAVHDNMHDTMHHAEHSK